MNVQEFERILKLGLGRAIVHLQNHDATPYRDVILHACLHNISFDPQLEGGKTVYLWDILQLTGEPEFYRDKILEAAAALTDEDDWDADHTLEMVFRFAEEGDQQAKQILYDHFTKRWSVPKNQNSLDTACARLIIELDQLKGFLFIAERFGKLAVQTPKVFDGSSDYLLVVLEDLIGKKKVAKALAEARENNPSLEAYLNLIEKFRKRRNSRKRDDIARLPYSEIKKQIATGKYIRGLQLWGTTASPDDLHQAAIDLLRENDPKRLRQYLPIFWRTPFPLSPEPLFKLAEHSEDRIPAMTFAVLEQINHPAIREFALKRIQENNKAGRAVGLLNCNFQDGDWALIEEVTKRQLDEEDHHSLEMSVRDIFDDHPAKEAATLLLNLYEYAPCSFCREYTVEDLHSINALPDHIREECRYDSNDDIRKLAKNNFLQVVR